MFNELVSPNVTYSFNDTDDTDTTATAITNSTTSMTSNVFGATIATYYNFKYSDLLDVGIIINNSISTFIIIFIIIKDGRRISWLLTLVHNQYLEVALSLLLLHYLYYFTSTTFF